jgi:hypothetical protein
MLTDQVIRSIFILMMMLLSIAALLAALFKLSVSPAQVINNSAPSGRQLVPHLCAEMTVLCRRIVFAGFVVRNTIAFQWLCAWTQRFRKSCNWDCWSGLSWRASASEQSQKLVELIRCLPDICCTVCMGQNSKSRLSRMNGLTKSLGRTSYRRDLCEARYRVALT